MTHRSLFMCMEVSKWLKRHFCLFQGSQGSLNTAPSLASIGEGSRNTANTDAADTKSQISFESNV